MRSLTFKSVRANRARFVLTAIAVMLGVAFIVGTLVLTDTIKAGYDEVATDSYRSTDAVVRSSRHLRPTNGAPAVRGTIPAAALATVRATPGVQAAEPERRGTAAVVGKDGRLVDGDPNRAVPVALGWTATDALNPLRIVAGTPPTAPDDVVVDRTTRADGHLAVGDRVRVVGPGGSEPFRISGVVTYGGADDAAGAQVVAFTPATAARFLGLSDRVSEIRVQGAAGWSQDRLVDSLDRTLAGAAGVEVVTGATAAAEARTDAGRSLQLFDTFLLTFAIVALVVGAFVIYNTFSITVAQRSKETALLRAIGASRRQVLRSIVLEALFVGTIASALGVGLGLGAAVLLRAALESFGMSLPSTATVVAGRTIAVAMVIGVVVTLLSAYLPARRAARIAPVEALRDSTVEPGRGRHGRAVAGALVTAAGGAAIAQGLAGADAGIIGLGAFGVFVGVAMLGPAIAGPFARVIGLPLWLRGETGRLARANAVRNPRRTAATASALMIGVGLVAMMTVFAASTRTSISDTIETAMKGDSIVRTQAGMGGLDPSVAARIAALPEVAAVTPLRYTNASVGGSTKDVTAIDPAHMAETVEANVARGSFADLGLDGVAVQAREAESKHLRLGDTVTLDFPETGARPLRVVAVYDTQEPLGKYAISLATYDANVTPRVDSDIVVANAPGVTNTQARHAIERVLRDTPTAELLTESQFKGQMADRINRMLNLVYVLLVLALVIAFFGIANTLALSVVERTREIGLLRAVGMARSQVRASVRWEAVLIALLGTALGVAIGLGFSWAIVTALEKDGFHEVTVPAGQLAAIAGLSALGAVVAAALPARRAARLRVLDAVSG
jgi:putative ABC transport system permease protein